MDNKKSMALQSFFDDVVRVVEENDEHIGKVSPVIHIHGVVERDQAKNLACQVALEMGGTYKEGCSKDESVRWFNVKMDAGDVAIFFEK